MTRNGVEIYFGSIILVASDVNRTMMLVSVRMGFLFLWVVRIGGDIMLYHTQFTCNYFGSDFASSWSLLKLFVIRVCHKHAFSKRSLFLSQKEPDTAVTDRCFYLQFRPLNEHYHDFLSNRP